MWSARSDYSGLVSDSGRCTDVRRQSRRVGAVSFYTYTGTVGGRSDGEFKESYFHHWTIAPLFTPRNKEMLPVSGQRRMECWLMLSVKCRDELIAKRVTRNNSR